MSDLQAEILDGAVFEERGVFTLAEDKAREKMRRFQLENPRKYLLQIIQALVASGATRIEVRVDPDTTMDLLEYGVQVVFDGPGYAPEELRDLYAHVFSASEEGARDRLRELALGVLSCQGIPARRIEIVSRGAAWVWSGGRDRVEERPEAVGHRIAVRGPGRAEEVRHLQENCQAVPITLTLDGQPLSHPDRRWAAAVPWPGRLFEVGEARGAVGLPYEDLRETRFALYRHGVQFACRRLPGLRPAVSLAVEHPGLRKNVSQTDVVEDDLYRELVDGLPAVVADLAHFLAGKEIPAYHREEVRGFLLAAVEEWLPPEVVLGNPGDWSPEVAAMADFRLFADHRGGRVSLRRIREAFLQDGAVYVCSRRMPYAPVGDWLLLNPSEAERPVLARCFSLADVDGEIHRILARGGDRPAVAPDPVRSLSRLREGSLQLVIPDRSPDGRCRLRWGDPGRPSVREFSFRGWSVDVEGPADPKADPEGLLLRARALLESRGDKLFFPLLYGLPSPGDPSRRAERARAREHLLTLWRSKIEDALGSVPPESSEERAVLCRQALGAHLWDQEIFETRSGRGVSLARVEAWIAGHGPLLVAMGGPRRESDHSLEASPSIVGFLSRIFGEEALERAARRGDRGERQAELTGTGPAREKEVRGPAEGPPVGLPPRPVPAPVEADPPAAGPEEVEAGRDGAAPDDVAAVPEGPRDGPGPAEEGKEVPPEPAREPEGPGPLDLAERRRLEEVSSLASHAFQEAGLEGYLAITLEPEGVQIWRGAQAVRVDDLLGRPVAGWVSSPVSGEVPGRWTAEEERVLGLQLEILADRLARSMAEGDPDSAEFVVGRSRLVGLLSASSQRVRNRLEASVPHDPLIHLRFLPFLGGGLGSLADLWPTVLKLGYAPVCPEMLPDGATPFPVALVGRVPEPFYRRIFLRTGRVKGEKGDSPALGLMLNAVRELRQARGLADYRFPEKLLDRMEWTDRGREAVVHDPESGRTLVNRKHPVIRSLVARFERDPSAAALLASAFFSAVNRALEDVRDEDEIRFLEALMETAPGA